MNLRRVSVLIGKELIHGPKQFIFIWAILAPIAVSLVLSFVFGTLFHDKPRLGIVDADVGLIAASRDEMGLLVYEYKNEELLRSAVSSGSVDVGIVFPDDLTSRIDEEKSVRLNTYVWGQSLAKDRVMIEAAVRELVNGVAGKDEAVGVQIEYVGDEVSLPWSKRIFPFIVMMAIFISGIILTAASIIIEKEKKTIKAITVAPTTTGELFTAKAVIGLLVSMVMGVLILLMNNAFGTKPWLLILLLFFGGIMSVTIGLSVGSAIKDLSTLFAVWKTGALILFGPAIVYMFPAIPQWIGKIFPTYYLMNPLIAVSQRGASLSEFVWEFIALLFVDAALIVVAIIMIDQFKKREQTA